MMKILYIYGYGSSKESSTYKNLKKLLTNDDVYCVYYPQENPKESIKILNKFIKDNNIDLVIGSSLGAYICTQLGISQRIIINPCVHPEIELELLKNPTVPNEILDSYKKYIKDHSVWKDWSGEDRLTTICVLSKYDELLGLKYEYELRKYVHNVFVIDDPNQKHRLSKENIKENIVPIIEYIDNIFCESRKYFSSGLTV